MPANPPYPRLSGHLTPKQKLLNEGRDLLDSIRQIDEQIRGLKFGTPKHLREQRRNELMDERDKLVKEYEAAKKDFEKLNSPVIDA